METIKRPIIKKYGFRFKAQEAIFFKVVRNWCWDEFGCHGDDKKWTLRINFFIRRGQDYGYSAIYFDNEEDAMACKLRWV